MSKEDDIRRIVLDELRKKGLLSNRESEAKPVIKVYLESGLGTVDGRPFKLSRNSITLLMILNENAVDAPISADELTNLAGYKNIDHTRVHVGRLREQIEGNEKSEQIVRTIWNVGYQLTSRVNFE